MTIHPGFFERKMPSLESLPMVHPQLYVLTGSKSVPTQPVITSALHHQEASDVGSTKALRASLPTEDAS